MGGRRHVRPAGDRLGASRSAPWSAHTRPGDGPARDELWGGAEPKDSLHDHRQEHKPLHGTQRGLDGGERTAHEWDIVPDPRRESAAKSVLEVPTFTNRWGTTRGSYTTIAHHGGFGKGVQRRHASAMETADDVVRPPWAELSDAAPQLSTDELAQRRIQLGPSQTWSRTPMESGQSARQEGRRMRDPTAVMPKDALRYPYGRGSHVKLSDCVTEPLNFGAPTAGQSVGEAITADVTGVPQWTHKPAVGPQRDHLDYSVEPEPDAWSTDVRPRSEVQSVPPSLALSGFHHGRYHREPHPDRGIAARGNARTDLPLDARVRHPLRKPTRLDTRDVRGGYYVTVDHPMRFGKRVNSHSPWTLSSDDVVKTTRRFADPRAWGAWANERDPEEIDLGFYWGLGAEGRKDRSLPLGDQYNVARPGYVYNGPRRQPSRQTATGGDTTTLLHNHSEVTNLAIRLAVWEKDDADTMRHRRDLQRRGQTRTTTKHRELGKQRRKKMQAWKSTRAPGEAPIGVDAATVPELPAQGNFGTLAKRSARPRVQPGRLGQSLESKVQGIRCHPMKSVVYAPSQPPPPNQHGPPSCKFSLVRAHGAGAQHARGGLVSNGSDMCVYFTGAVAVIHDALEDKQRFFQKHDAVITAVAVHADGRTFATAQGGDNPLVIVWDSRTGQELGRFTPPHQGSIAFLAFSVDGDLLLAVGADQFHTMGVWAWHKATLHGCTSHQAHSRLLASSRGPQSQVLACVAAPSSRAHTASFITCGVHHLKVWDLEQTHSGAELSDTDVHLHRRPPGESSNPHTSTAQTWTCLAQLLDGSVLVGSTAGDIHQISCASGAWRPVAKVAAHDGFVSAVCSLGAGSFCSGGKDGRILVWEAPDDPAAETVSRRSPSQQSSRSRSAISQRFSSQEGAASTPISQYESVVALELAQHLVAAGASACARAIAPLQPGHLAILTSTNSVVCIDQETLQTAWHVHGHAKRPTALAMHPLSQAYVTIGADATVVVWALNPHQVLAATELAIQPTAVAISPTGQAVAVGLANGEVLLLDMSVQPQGGLELRDQGERSLASDGRQQLKGHSAVVSLAYSPNGAFLAAGLADGNCTLFSVRSEFSKLARLPISGPKAQRAAAVVALDFSADGQWLRASTASHEHHYWNVDDASEEAEGALTLRDVRWHSWRSDVGWAVMGVWNNHEADRVLPVDVAPAQDVVAVGGHRSVSLYRYPCPEKRAEARVLAGHGSGVVASRFSAGGDFLVSMASDQSLLVWQRN